MAGMTLHIIPSSKTMRQCIQESTIITFASMISTRLGSFGLMELTGKNLDFLGMMLESGFRDKLFRISACILLSTGITQVFKLIMKADTF